VVASYLTSGSAPVGGLIVPAFEVVAPAQVGLNPKNLERAEAAVSTDVRRGLIPGAALVVGRGAEVVEKKGIGRLGSGLAEVDPDSTIYDLASLTKVVATTSAIMLLVEEGKVELDAPVQRYLPEFQGGLKNRVTVRQLLTHTSGLPAGASPPKGTPDETLKRLIATPLKTKPGERMVYSDLGPIILFAVAERVAGEAVPVMLERRVFAPLGMTSTKFGQLDACDACAPTTSGTRGLVHDPLARRLGGVAGNAGLFSTASDIGRFAAMMAGGGALGEVRIFREETVREFTARQKGAGDRALGWVTPGTRRATGSEGERISDSAFGHTGFTGTSLWIDPERGTWAVLLSNRTYIAGAPNRMQALRRTINNLVSAAVDAGS
jgi:CubicO group peptidase (beta-lactamase class C family)